MKKINLILLSAIFGLISGCSSAPTMQQLARDSANADRVRLQAAQEQREQQQKSMEDALSKIPSWALESPHPDATGVYAVGSGSSDNVTIALHKATLDAEFGLAKIYKQELSGSERSYNKDDGGRTSGSQYIELIDKLVEETPVTGFEVVHQDVKVIDAKYNAYVLLKLPYAQFNSVIKEQESKTSDATVEVQFKDLERRLEMRRQQHANDNAARIAEIANKAAAIGDTPVPAK